MALSRVLTVLIFLPGNSSLVPPASLLGRMYGRGPPPLGPSTEALCLQTFSY